MLIKIRFLCSQFRNRNYQYNLLNIFLGVSNIQFKLSYNSSVLNVWSVTPLIYAGLREAQVHSEKKITIGKNIILNIVLFSVI